MKPHLTHLTWQFAQGLIASAALTLLPVQTMGSTAYGTINNFDVVNDTRESCHGFEIELEDIVSKDITYTYDWNHYGTPKIQEEVSIPAHPKVIVRYASSKNPDGSWAAYTAIPTNSIAPTDGHRFTDPGVNFGGEHFGVGYRVNPTKVLYFWLIASAQGELVRGPAVMVSTPTFNLQPGAIGQVQAIIEPVAVPPIKEFGPAVWVKAIRTTTHSTNKVHLRDLVSDDPDDSHDINWRNGQPDEVEVEWKLLQTEFAQADGGVNGKLAAEPEELKAAGEVVTRRYEFFDYVGPLDPESGEAQADKVGPDGIHGIGVKQQGDQQLDLSKIEVVGPFLGAQMSAFDAKAAVGLVEHTPDGAVDEKYPTRTLVIAGANPFGSTNWGELPAGMSYNTISGELSGTPTKAGQFVFTIQVTSGQDPVVQKTYTLNIAAQGGELPAQNTVDTVADPLDGGRATGDGSYPTGSSVTVRATSVGVFAFSYWTDHGVVVSRNAQYTFTLDVNHSLQAHFVADSPQLLVKASEAGGIQVSWSALAPAFQLQASPSLTPAAWTPVAGNVVVEDGVNHVSIPAEGAVRFFRLEKR